jgi:Outer membrane protein beta-barrel domain
MRQLALNVLFVSIATAMLSAQPVSVGVLGGVPLIDQTTSHDESRPYIVGPSFEVRLPAGFALEADALYQRIGNTSSFALIDSFLGTSAAVTTSETTRTRANEWQFPLLGKYYFRRSSTWQPFVGTGWAFRFAEIHESGTETLVNSGTATSTFTFNNSFRSDLEVGATFAAGIRYRIGHFALQPQVRYTRWGGQNYTFSKNEAFFALGISF